MCINTIQNSGKGQYLEILCLEFPFVPDLKKKGLKFFMRGFHHLKSLRIFYNSNGTKEVFLMNMDNMIISGLAFKDSIFKLESFKGVM